MAYDYSKLRGKIVEKFGTQSKFSQAIGLSERSLSLKITSKVPFRQVEISRCCKLLDIPETEIAEYFFTPKVQSFEQI